MLNKLVGKLLYRNSPAWQQRRLANTTMLVLFTSFVFATALVAVMYWMNVRRM